MQQSSNAVRSRLGRQLITLVSGKWDVSITIMKASKFRQKDAHTDSFVEFGGRTWDHGFLKPIHDLLYS